MKITTKTGDKGQTSLFGGRRVSKSDNSIDLLGEIDELQSFIGWAKSYALEEKAGGNLVEVLMKIEDDLYRIMSIVGFEFKVPKSIKKITEEDVNFLEKEIEDGQSAVGDLSEFVRPGQGEMSSRLHVARCVCRRVERSFVRFGDELCDKGRMPDEKLFAAILKYLNRLSDLLFIYAYSLSHVGIPKV